MDPLDYLAQLGGVARTGQLLAAGFSRTDIARLATVVRQPRRGVLALPECRPEFEAALRHNARVTCASAAGHYGLWLRAPPASTDNASTLRGFDVLRYMPEHIWFEPQRVVAEIRAVLGQRPLPAP